MHDQALADAQRTGKVGQQMLDATAAVSTRLLTAQARNPLLGSSTLPRDWLARAGFTNNVFAENPAPLGYDAGAIQTATTAPSASS